MTSLTADTYWVWQNADGNRSTEIYDSYAEASEASSLFDDFSKTWTRTKTTTTDWVNIGELALKSDISADMDAATREYVDEQVLQEAEARQQADQELRASIGEKADIN